MTDPAVAQVFRYTLSLDCKAAGIRATGSEALLEVRYLGSNGEVLAEPRISLPRSPDRPRDGRTWTGRISDELCRSSTDFAKALLFYSDAEVKYVQIETNGDDALWIDRALLQQDFGSEPRWRPRSTHTWGKDGGNGYCLSTRRTDYLGAWEPYVGNGRKCRTCFEFNLDEQKVANECR
ncbi:MAG: hypothetical protein AB7E72_14965 [Lysobacterales bacterium]